MSGEVEVALAFIARREARAAMTAARWAHVLCFELGWMNPGQARAFVQRAIASGLLAPDGDLMRFVLDPAGVQVPRGFKPDPLAIVAASASAPAPEPDLFLGWVARLAAHHAVPREHILGRVAAVQERMGGMLTAEAAALWLARDAGMDVAEAARAAAQALKPGRAAAQAPAPAGTP
ncbi:MAG: DUF2240 family protein [Candidatus Thermoplasmatota archaeon]